MNHYMKKSSQDKREEKFRKFKRLHLLDNPIDECIDFVSLDDILTWLISYSKSPKNNILHAVYFDRVSSPSQKNKKILKRRKEVLKNEVERKGNKYGVRIILDKKMFLECEKAYSNLIEKRESLIKAVRRIKELESQNDIVALLTPSVNRIIRPHYSRWKKDKNSPLRESDISLLKTIIDYVIIVTITKPGTGSKRQESILRAIGQKNPNKKLGRPKIRKPGMTKKFGDEYGPMAKELREQGMIYRIIHKIICEKVKEKYNDRVGETTVKDWVKKLSKSEKKKKDNRQKSD